LLGPALRRLSPDNAQGEYYLTDVVEVLAGMGHRSAPWRPGGRDRASTIDGSWRSPNAAAQPHQPASAERRDHARIRQTFIITAHPAATPLYPGSILQGNTVIGDGCEIGPDTRLVDCVVGSVIREQRRARKEVGDDAHVGPYAYLAPGTSVLVGIDGRADRTCRLSTWAPITEKFTTKRMSLFSDAPILLAEEVAKELSVELDPNLRSSPTAIRPRFRASGSDVPSANAPRCDELSINDSIMEQLIMIDTAYRASAKRITAVCPFFGYARQDHKAEGREPITARLVADLFKAAGAKRMVSIDLHSGQIQGFFEGPVDHLTATPVLEHYIRQHAVEPVIVSPDAGRIKVAARMAEHLGDLGADLAFIYKRRPKGSVNQAEAKEVIGDVDGRLCILTDDMIDSGGTITSAADILLERGATEVWAMATHGVLSGPAIDRLKNAPISRVVLTNTLPLRRRSRSTRSRCSRSPRSLPTRSTRSSRTRR
jgi:ribose-phosphate pyrophosphokinase